VACSKSKGEQDIGVASNCRPTFFRKYLARVVRAAKSTGSSCIVDLGLKHDGDMFILVSFGEYSELCR
jgi:hypothetical protein